MAISLNPFQHQHDHSQALNWDRMRFEEEIRRQRYELERHQREMMQQAQMQMSPPPEISVRRYQDLASFREYEIRYNLRTREEQIKEIARIETFAHGEGRPVDELIRPVDNEKFFADDSKKHKNRRKLFWARYRKNNLIKSLVMAKSI